MQTKVSIRWQTVIPRDIRRALQIEPHMKLEWQVEDGVIIIRPIPKDPVRASRGLLKGRGLSSEALAAERRKEREKET